MKRPILVVVLSALGGSLLTLVLLGLVLFFSAGAPLLASSREFAMAGGEVEDGWAEAKVGRASPAPPAVESLARPYAAKLAAPSPAASAPRAEKRKAAEDDEFDKIFGGGAPSEVPTAAEGSQRATPSGAWFPETFLFQPEIVTDEAGVARIDARVPDRLTTWRVLALAHSREGAQAGAVTSFRGTLPTYVDLVVPPFVTAGDEVKLPIQVVNTTEEPVQQPLKVEAAGAEVSMATAPIKLGPSGSEVRYATLKIGRGPRVAVRAILGSADAVVRTIPVVPSGRPLELRQSGTLAAPRTFTLDAPAGLDAPSTTVKLLVFPGALSVLRAELGAALSRSGAAEDAYALQLAGRAPELLKALGETPDAEALRRMRLVASQRVSVHARAPTAYVASLLAEAASAHPDDPILARLGERVAAKVAGAQRPDGTFEGETGWTLQRLLVMTAECVRALEAAASQGGASRHRAAAAALRASGAFERNLGHVQDPYTAASILANAGLSGRIAERLRARVREAVVAGDDGTRRLEVPVGVVRPDGTRPTVVEATALAALALQDDREAPWRVDLAAHVIGTYQPGLAWGDGRTNQVALRAVLGAFREPVPSAIRIMLALDGKPIGEARFDGAKTREVMSLDAPAPVAAGKHEWTVSAEPAIPGLGFSLTLRTSVPWKIDEAGGGLELQVKAPPAAKAGEWATVELHAAAPAGMPLEVRHALPAGVNPDRASLEKLKTDGLIQSFETEDGAVTLQVAPLAPGRTFDASYRVFPSLAGSLRSAASSVAVAGASGVPRLVAPAIWMVK